MGPEAVSPKHHYYDADDALNDKGLCIGLTVATADPWSYGLIATHIIKLIAESCTTVEDALKVFKRVPLCCPKNFFIADKNGDMAIVEHTSEKYKIIYHKNGILIQTNHFVDPELAKDDTVLICVPGHNTCLRYKEDLQKITAMKTHFKIWYVMKILGIPGSVVCE